MPLAGIAGPAPEHQVPMVESVIQRTTAEHNRSHQIGSASNTSHNCTHRISNTSQSSHRQWIQRITATACTESPTFHSNCMRSHHIGSASNTSAQIQTLLGRWWWRWRLVACGLPFLPLLGIRRDPLLCLLIICVSRSRIDNIRATSAVNVCITCNATSSHGPQTAAILTRTRKVDNLLTFCQENMRGTCCQRTG